MQEINELDAPAALIAGGAATSRCSLPWFGLIQRFFLLATHA